MDQGRQGRDQVDTAVVQDVRGQRRAAPASCARLQSWQLSPHACNTGADQGLVADELEGEADQDRREGGEPHFATCSRGISKRAKKTYPLWGITCFRYWVLACRPDRA